MIPLRYFTAFLLGPVLYSWCYHPWLPYAQRERSQTLSGYAVLIFGAAIGGFILAWGARSHRFGIAATFLAGLFATNAFVISMDWKVDRTDHNLFPFEFVILAILALPAFLGAAVGGRK